MEKQLELYLPSTFDDLIAARRQNRIYFERKILKTINTMLCYERLYREKGVLTSEDIKEEDEKDIKKIMKGHPYVNLVNMLLIYLVANVISNYLIEVNFDFNKDDFCTVCDKAYLSSLCDSFCDRGITSSIVRKRVNDSN